MSTKRNALELADFLAGLRSPRCGESAAELRRLTALNAQMLEALEAAKHSLDCLMRETGRTNMKADVMASEVARAAIKAAKEN